MLTFSFKLFSQNKIAGYYEDYFGNSIFLNSDSSFKYNWNFDLASSWSKGTWSYKNDTIYFHVTPVYDTLKLIKENNLFKDTLVLSQDENSGRLTQGQFIGVLLSGGGQNRKPSPDKLLFKKGRLYEIVNGKLLRKKRKGFWSNKKWYPWYFKSDG